MTDLETQLALWEGFNDSYRASVNETAKLLATACLAEDDHPAVWPRLAALLSKHTPMKAKEAMIETHRAKVTARLGDYPYTAKEYVRLYIKREGIRMTFGGQFNGQDFDYIANEMLLLAGELSAVKEPLFSKALIDAAFVNWKADQQKQALASAYAKVRFDPSASSKAIDDFAAFITAPTDDPEETASAVEATAVVLRNFIYRVKNHMRGQWRHSSHVMPVLVGKQGGGKTHAVNGFLSPFAGDMHMVVGFDIFDDNSKMWDLSVMPIMFFDEMSGIGKADFTKLKNFMTTKTKNMRQIYGRSTSRVIVSTFIGCSNNDLNTMLHDETGNRRFLQINVPQVLDLKRLDAFDYMSMWRSVDENAAEPPMYASEQNRASVEKLQSGQRYVGLVRDWIDSDDTLPTSPTNVPTLYSDYFSPWAERMYPQKARFLDLTKFRSEIERIRLDELPDRIIKTKPKNVISYRFASEPREASVRVLQTVPETPARESARDMLHAAMRAQGFDPGTGRRL